MLAFSVGFADQLGAEVVGIDPADRVEGGGRRIAERLEVPRLAKRKAGTRAYRVDRGVSRERFQHCRDVMRTGALSYEERNCSSPSKKISLVAYGSKSVVRARSVSRKLLTTR